MLTDRSPCKVRVLPYNIRCNHRHPVQRLQATRAKLGMEGPGTLVQVVRPQPEPNRYVWTVSAMAVSKTLATTQQVCLDFAVVVSKTPATTQQVRLDCFCLGCF